MSALLRTKSKKPLRRPISAVCGAVFHALPQKIVKTSTAEMSGPFRYVSRAAGAAARVPGTCSGTIRIESESCRCGRGRAVERTLDLAIVPLLLHLLLYDSGFGGDDGSSIFHQRR